MLDVEGDLAGERSAAAREEALEIVFEESRKKVGRKWEESGKKAGRKWKGLTL